MMNDFLNQWDTIESDTEKPTRPYIDLTEKFPYSAEKIFIETPFFLIDTRTKLFIPERMYEKKKWIYNNKTSYYVIINNNKESVEEQKVNSGSEIRVIFLTTEGNKVNIIKNEYSITVQLEKAMNKNGVKYTIRTKYYLYSPYYTCSISDNFKECYDVFDKNLNSNCQIYLNRKLLVPEVNYIIDTDNNKFCIFNTSGVNENSVQEKLFTFDILTFHSADPNRIENLPQTGFIYLDKNKVDRNYNRNELMTIFLNGKLTRSTYMKQMTNTIYKIHNNIKDRYDLNILNTSPKIDQLLPFYKGFEYADTVKKSND